ncbi:N-acetyl-gamma-glutamyl-phosphate reductase [Imperialibacter roseus]|uniref:N-acetyl-gamma-glutamyl-phosphate reductase n=1 Tax=Imperialibacter roseus TaxID=1324217 RepID=A0ABZ0IKJ8_9BACT|nr:N-acetyl-gamma-glutamyl-phosphate reductase [Imperialibacter roseus]WOK04850.1 N-acetyl-gamma-glutamyl-phosphate reductase [Imperialibacter roseus]
MPKKKIGVVGATGYTGSELVRILANHPEVEIAVITSESRAGEKFSDVHPFFKDIVDQPLHKADKVNELDLDLVFLALPHGVSMEYVKQFAGKGFKIVDFSGDFRLDSPKTYEEWYNKPHTFVEGFDTAVYGLPELFYDKIKGADLVANPGCYPTSAILPLAPLLANGIIESKGIIIDAKSGITGAGIKASTTTHFSNVNDNFKAYGLKNHRHTIEIQGVLDGITAGVTLQFTPHLLPVDRGILSTTYARPKGATSSAELKALYQDFYKDKPFVRICGTPPAIKDVRGSNYCNIYADFDERTGNIILISTIDNLVKGAAGQAVQNMNIMLGFEESLGLNQIPVNP